MSITDPPKINVNTAKDSLYITLTKHEVPQEFLYIVQEWYEIFNLPYNAAVYEFVCSIEKASSFINGLDSQEQFRLQCILFVSFFSKFNIENQKKHKYLHRLSKNFHVLLKSYSF